MERSVAVVPVPGELDRVHLAAVRRAPPSDDEVEIAVEAAGLNFKDVLLALGVLPATDVRLGFECAGRIVACGASVRDLAIGDSVVAIGAGCLASSVSVPASTVCRRPAWLDAVAAATLPVAFTTASHALETLARLRSGERVLIHAAGGGVGLAAVQIARRRGAMIFATAGRAEKRAYLRGLGIAHVFDSRTPAFADEILRIAGGVDVVLNSLTGELLARSFDVLAPHGRFIELGVRDALEGRSLPLARFAGGASYCALGHLGGFPGVAARLAETMTRVERAELVPLPRTVFPATELAAALTYLARAQHLGKVVVTFEREPTADAAYLTCEEGVALFEQALASGCSHVLVAKTSLSSRSGAPPSPPIEPRPMALVTLDRSSRDELAAGIAGVLADMLRVDPVGINDDFFALGGDSLLAVQVAHTLARRLGVHVPTHLLLEHPTAAKLAERLSARPQETPRLVRLVEGPVGARPLHVVHPIGGHVYFYRPLAARLAATCPVWGIQAQGIDGREPPLASVEAMAAQYVAAIRANDPRGPYRLAGASFGGVVAYAMARILAADGARVELLALIDSPGPGALPQDFAGDAEILAYLLARGGADEGHRERLRGLSADERLAYFVRYGGAADRLTPEADVADVGHFLALYRANYRAMVDYEPPPYAGAALFFSAREHDGVNHPDPARAWVDRVAALTVVPVDGNHTTMNLPPHVDAIATHLAKYLADGPDLIDPPAPVTTPSPEEQP